MIKESPRHSTKVTGHILADLLGACLLLASCSGPQAAEHADASAPPAKVAHAVEETALTTVTLTPQAEARLGIETVPVERRTVNRTRSYSGEVVVPPGRQLVVSAPVAGTVSSVESGELPLPGSSVSAGQKILRLTPLVAPERDLRAEVERQVAAAEARLQAAATREKRAAQLLQDRAGSQRSHEEAREQLALAEVELTSAQSRLDRLGTAPLDADYGLIVSSPRAGTLRNVMVTLGQTVPAAAPLFEIAALDTVWVRVPIYAGESGSLDLQASATVHGIARTGVGGGRQARPVSAPPTADPASNTIDQYYELSNSAGVLRPGERVGVTVLEREGTESLVVPYSSLLYDVDGGTWVYVAAAPQVYTRQKVEVRRVAESLAVLTRGPAEGERVVSVGAAELFSTEFSTGK